MASLLSETDGCKRPEKSFLQPQTGTCQQFTPAVAAAELQTRQEKLPRSTKEPPPPSEAPSGMILDQFP